MVTDKDLMAVIRASRPSFKNPADKAAFAVHASFLASGYFLTAVGPPAFSDSALASPSCNEVGIDGWNEIDGEYAFVYAKSRESGLGSKKMLVKCLVLSDKLLVDAVSDAAASPLAHLEINIADHNGEENNGSNYAAQFKNLDKLAKGLNDEILSKLEPPPTPTDHSSSKPSSSRTGEELIENLEQPHPQSGGPYMESSGIIYPPIPFAGNSDLFPGPGAGMYPTRHGFGGGSMMIGPNDPRWFGDSGPRPGFSGLPPGVPPGARFDLYGPPGIGGFEPPRRNMGVGRGTRIHPDLEQPGGGSFLHPSSDHFDYI